VSLDLTHHLSILNAPALELFDAWRFAEADASLALAAWRSASQDGKRGAYAAYVAALEREARAAEILVAATARRGGERAWDDPEIPQAVMVRRSRNTDRAALARLAALDSRQPPAGPCLVAERNGQLVAAAALDAATEPISDPFQPTADVRELLALRARQIRGAARLPHTQTSADMRTSSF
jgi:hypothetical protein